MSADRSSAEMDNLDVAVVMGQLLRRPLMNVHADQLRKLKYKEECGQLSEVDKIYIIDLWHKFRSLPPIIASGARDDSSGDVTNRDDLLAEMKRLNVTVEKLRAALKQVAEHRDQLKDEVARLAKIAAPHDEANRRFEKTKISFAKFYHPNTLSGFSHLDVPTRGEVFREFWAELERIEAEG
jgi:hypothetical protein